MIKDNGQMAVSSEKKKKTSSIELHNSYIS